MKKNESTVTSIRLSAEMLSRIDELAKRLREETGMSIERSEAIRWLLTKALEYESTRDLPDVQDGKFALTNLAYRPRTRSDSPLHEFFVFQKHLFDKGPCFIVSMSSDSTRRARKLLQGSMDVGRFEKAIAVAIGRVTRRYKGKREDRLSKIPIGKENAVPVHVLDSDFVPTIGRSFKSLRST